MKVDIDGIVTSVVMQMDDAGLTVHQGIEAADDIANELADAALDRANYAVEDRPEDER